MDKDVGLTQLENERLTSKSEEDKEAPFPYVCKLRDHFVGLFSFWLPSPNVFLTDDRKTHMPLKQCPM